MLPAVEIVRQKAAKGEMISGDELNELVKSFGPLVGEILQIDGENLIACFQKDEDDDYNVMQSDVEDLLHFYDWLVLQGSSQLQDLRMRLRLGKAKELQQEIDDLTTALDEKRRELERLRGA
jgi:hypothetical protein